jgi:hypothetical protein
MLKRAWLLFSITWAALFLWNGSTKENGGGMGDVMLAVAPWLIGAICRYIVFGGATAGPDHWSRRDYR